jgi:hypothetical protein
MMIVAFDTIASDVEARQVFVPVVHCWKTTAENVHKVFSCPRWVRSSDHHHHRHYFDDYYYQPGPTSRHHPGLFPRCFPE